MSNFMVIDYIICIESFWIAQGPELAPGVGGQGGRFLGAANKLRNRKFLNMTKIINS
jgi:hypothetical protein